MFRKNPKKVKSFLSIIAIVTLLAIQLIVPLTQGTAMAAGTIFDNLEMNQRIQVRNLAIVVEKCYAVGDDKVSGEEMLNGRWFAGGSGGDTNVVVGTIVEPEDGVVDCAGDDAGWVATFIKLAGYASLQDGFNALSVPKAANSSDPNGKLKPINEIKQILNAKFGTDIYTLGNQEYLTYRSNFWNFINVCQATEIASPSNAGLTATIYKVQDGAVKSQLYSYKDETFANVIGVEQSDSNGDIKCSSLVGYLATKSHADAYLVALNAQMTATGKTQTQVEGGNGAGGSGSSTGGGSTPAEATCGDVGGVFGWLICEAASIVDDFAGFLETELRNLLKMPELGPGSEVYAAWSSIRTLATSVLVLVALFAIAAQIFNLDFISAYTMRKIIPRIIIATILLFTSYFLASLMILFVNALGDGVAAIIMGPFDDGKLLAASNSGGAIQYILAEAGITGGQAAGSIGILVGAGAVAFVGAAGLGGIIIAVALVAGAILVAFVTLILRKVFILGLVMVMPLAIIAWILPNTQKWATSWWSLFSKLLFMYPLVIGLLAVGRVAAYLIATSGDVITNSASINWYFAATASATGSLVLIMILIAYFAPYYFIPSMFKATGGMFAKINSSMDGFGKKYGRKAGEKIGSGVGDYAASNYKNGGSKTKNAAIRMATGNVGAFTKGGRYRQRAMLANKGAKYDSDRTAEDNALVGSEVYGMDYDQKWEHLQKRVAEAKTSRERGAYATALVGMGKEEKLADIFEKGDEQTKKNLAETLRQKPDVAKAFTNRRPDVAFALASKKYGGVVDESKVESNLDGYLSGLEADKIAQLGPDFFKTQANVNKIGPRRTDASGKVVLDSSGKAVRDDAKADELLASVQRMNIYGQMKAPARKAIDEAAERHSNNTAAAAAAVTAAAAAAAPPPPPRVVSTPPTATATTTDGKYYTDHPTPYIPDPSDPSKNIPNPAADWKETK